MAGNSKNTFHSYLSLHFEIEFGPTILYLAPDVEVVGPIGGPEVGPHGVQGAHDAVESRGRFLNRSELQTAETGEGRQTDRVGSETRHNCSTASPGIQFKRGKLYSKG